MKNIQELISKSVKIYGLLKDGKISVSEANGLNKTTDVVIKAAKTKLEYNKFQGDHSKIDFLEGS